MAITVKTLYKAGQMVYILNPNTVKSQPENISPFMIIKSYEDQNTYTLHNFKDRERKLYINSLLLFSPGITKKTCYSQLTI